MGETERETCKRLNNDLENLKSAKPPATPFSSPTVSTKTSLPQPVTSTEKEAATTVAKSLTVAQPLEIPAGGFKFAASVNLPTKEANEVVDLTENNPNEGKDAMEDPGEVEPSKSMEEESEPQSQDTKSNEESMKKKILLKRKKELEVTLLNKKEEEEDFQDTPTEAVEDGRKRMKVEERKDAVNTTEVDGAEGGNA